MAGVRRVCRSILRYAYPVYVIAIILQVYFAGEGIFGAGDSSIEDAKSLNLHRDFGWFISQPFALLLLIVTLLPGCRTSGSGGSRSSRRSCSSCSPSSRRPAGGSAHCTR